MAGDYNSLDEAAERKQRFVAWLLRAWMYLDEHNKLASADIVRGLLDRADEPDFPLWEMAARTGLTGASALGKQLVQACGIPVQGARASQWEKALNYAPVISLEERVWHEIHGALGWANRNSDPAMNVPNFWLFSSATNIVRFVMRKGGISDEPAA